jgi:hypothetical protein
MSVNTVPVVSKQEFDLLSINTLAHPAFDVPCLCCCCRLWRPEYQQLDLDCWSEKEGDAPTNRYSAARTSEQPNAPLHFQLGTSLQSCLCLHEAGVSETPTLRLYSWDLGTVASLCVTVTAVKDWWALGSVDPVGKTDGVLTAKSAYVAQFWGSFFVLLMHQPFGALMRRESRNSSLAAHSKTRF